MKNAKSTGKVPSIREHLEDGHVTIWLEGEKLRGGYALIRTSGGEETRWLLIKMDDEEAIAGRNPTSTELKSVISGRTLDKIREA